LYRNAKKAAKPLFLCLPSIKFRSSILLKYFFIGVRPPRSRHRVIFCCRIPIGVSAMRMKDKNEQSLA
jgi:hypothetical protein